MYRALRNSTSSLAIVVTALGTASAQEAGQTTTLETITISGELIGRSWMETGTSVQGIDAEQLEVLPSLETVRDVLEDTVNMTTPTGAAKAPTVRGVDGTGPAENANAFFAGSRARLGLRIDGRPASYNEIVFGNPTLWDVDSIEVLRGAQSTLVGRNAIAGTVVVKTKDPVFDYSGAVETSVGNFDGRRISGMVNLPIIDNVLAARLAADWQGSTSAVSYDSFPGVENPGDIRALALRGKVLAKPDLGLDSTLRLTASHSSNKGPNGEIIVRPFDEKRSNYPLQPVHKPVATSIGAQFDIDLDERWRFELDGSYTDFSFARTTTVPGSNARIDAGEFFVEPRVRYAADSGWEALLGAHYYSASQDESIQFVMPQAFDDKTKTYAIYGEVVVPLPQSFKLALGARYERETRRRSGGDATGSIASINTDRTFEAFLPKISLNWQPSEEQSYGIQVSRGYNAGGGGIAFGFPNPFPIIHYEYDAEHVWTYEIYGRQQLLDGRLRLTQNLFYSRYEDMQLPFDLTPEDSRDELFVVRNANRVVTYGAELGASFDVTDTVSLFGNVGLLKTQVENYPGSGIEGNSLFGAPNLTASAGVTWKHEGWNASVSARYSNGYFTDINNRPRGKTEPYMVADARLGYDFGSIHVFGEVKNIFDTDKAVAFYPGATSDADTAVLIQPRSFRFGMGARF